jgi:hypothetical protein
MLASLLFPYDDDAPNLIDGWLDELEGQGCISRYMVDGQKYLQINNWLEHQKIDKPSKSKFPPKEPESNTTREDSPKAREHSSEDQGPRTKEGRGEDAREDPREATTHTPSKIANREALAKCLRRLGLRATEDAGGIPGTITEWADLMQGRGRCRTPEQALQGIRWIVEQAKVAGIPCEYAKHAGPLADRWAKMMPPNGAP